MLLILREELVCIIILLFLISYYIFNKVKDKEMLFLKLSLASLLHVVFDVVTVITVNHPDIVPEGVNRVCHIAFYLSGVLFAITFYWYVLQLCAMYRYITPLKTVGFALMGVFTVLLLFLPMEYVEGRGTNYSYGPLAFVGYALFLIYCTVSLVLLFKSRNDLDPRVRRAMIPMILVMYGAIILQAIIPELLMTGANTTLICIATFVTLDNPDKDFMRQALWDISTGLKNRNCYNRDLSLLSMRTTGRRGVREIGLLVADLNYLKAVNDQHGHAEGDRLISSAARAMRESLRSAEEIYRLGGDEFAALYLSPRDESIWGEIQTLRALCTADQSHAVPLSLAVGYASGSITSGPIQQRCREIFDRADQQMYADKQRIKQEQGTLGGR